MVFEQVLQLLMLAATVLIFWWSHRSFPPEQTAQLLKELGTASKQTQTELDDRLVEIAELLNALRTMPQPNSTIGETADEASKQ